MKAYQTLDENRVITNGTISIDGVLHIVKDRFVKCDRSLNGRAWNINEPVTKCPKCFDGSMFGEQLKIEL